MSGHTVFPAFPNPDWSAQNSGSPVVYKVKVSPYGFNSAHTDDASFSNVLALAYASSCKAANNSTISVFSGTFPRKFPYNLSSFRKFRNFWSNGKRSLTKPRGSKIRACSHSDLGEFLFWWRNCHWSEKIEKSLSDFSNFLRWNSLRFGREVIPY